VILVDTCVWVEHFRAGHPQLTQALDRSQVLGHRWVVGELALGSMGNRIEILTLLRGLPQADVASDEEVLTFIDQRELYGMGIGYVDAQLLCSTLLRDATHLWTTDKRLVGAADRLGIRTQPT
jgi:predicted nucleic acid-binding protein